MSSWKILAIGVVVGLIVALLLRRKTVRRPAVEVVGVEHLRPAVVAAPAAVVSPELERLNQMQAAGTITQAEYDILRGRLVDTGAGDVCTLTIVAGTRNKIRDIKAIREAVHMDLRDAKDVADRVTEGTPQVIARNLPRSEAVRLQQILVQAGLQVRIS